MPKHKSPPALLFGSKSNYKTPLTDGQRGDIEALNRELSKRVEDKYPGLDCVMVIGPCTAVTGSTNALILQILRLIHVLAEKTEASEEATKIVEMAAKILSELISPDQMQKICIYYDGHFGYGPERFAGPEGRA